MVCSWRLTLEASLYPYGLTLPRLGSPCKRSGFSERRSNLDTPPYLLSHPTPMWKGRFTEQTAQLVQQYSESISFDWRFWRVDIEGSIAHSAALEKAGLITTAERTQIVDGLRAIGAEIERGEFKFQTELEDIHMNVESELTRRIGDAGAKLHTARSRNDQVALDFRLYLRGECDVLAGLLGELQRALVELGERHAGVIIPG